MPCGKTQGSALCHMNQVHIQEQFFNFTRNTVFSANWENNVIINTGQSNSVKTERHIKCFTVLTIIQSLTKELSHP